MKSKDRKTRSNTGFTGLMILLIILPVFHIYAETSEPEVSSVQEKDGMSDDSELSNAASMRQTIHVIKTLADGEDYLEFNMTTKSVSDGKYHNKTVMISVPRNSKIQSASFDVQGLSSPFPDNIISNHNFTSTSDKSGYAGIISADPPSGPPQTLKSQFKFTSTEIQKINAFDFLNVTNSSSGGGSYAFHMFEFNLSTEEFGAVNFTWVGHGVLMSDPAIYTSKLFYWNGTAFNLKAEPSGQGGSDFIVNTIIDDSGMLDQNGNLHVIIMSPAENATAGAELRSNFVQAQTLKNGTGLSFPYNLSVDIGDDGAHDSMLAGELHGPVSMSQDLVGAFQAEIDSAEDGYGNINIPMRFSSEKAGRINISNIYIAYTLLVVPELIQDIPNSTVIYEDSGWVASGINLSDYFNDGFGKQNLSYEFSYKQDESELDARINQSTDEPEFSSGVDFNGVREFRVMAMNKGVDGIKGNSDDKIAFSNIFHVTVLPSNDPPVISSLVFQSGTNKTVFSHNIKLIYSDERAVEDSMYILRINAYDPEGDDFNFSCNLTDGLGSDDLDNFQMEPDNGTITFLPTAADVGTVYFNITVTDKNTTGHLTDYLEVELWVDEWNDPPVITTEGPLTAYEDNLNYFQVEAFDEEGSQLIYRTNLTDGLGFDDRDDLTINRDTGLIGFKPEHDDIGSVWINISVEDINEGMSYKHLEIIVKNVNDPPIVLNIGRMAAVKNEIMLFQVDYRTWLNLSIKYFDEDGDDVTFSARPLSPTENLPENFNIDNELDMIRFFPSKDVKDFQADFYVNITASDGNATSGTGFAWLEIQVLDINDPPEIFNVDFDIQSGRVTFKLNAGDLNGDITKVIWDFGDDSPSLTSYSTGWRNHSYSLPGNYTITVKVIDSHNASDTFIFHVNLTEDDFPPRMTYKPPAEAESKAWFKLGIAAVIIMVLIIILIIYMILRRKQGALTKKEREDLKKFVEKEFGLTRRKTPDIKLVLDDDEGESTAKVEWEKSKDGNDFDDNEDKQKQTKLSRFGAIFGGKKD